MSTAKSAKCSVIGCSEGYLNSYGNMFTTFEYDTSIHFVNYNTSGGDLSIPMQCLSEGEQFTVEMYLGMKHGYGFCGWSDGKNVIIPGTVIVMGKENVTITAVWKELSDVSIPFFEISGDEENEASIYATISECTYSDGAGSLDIYLCGSPSLSYLDFTVTFNPDHFRPTSISSSDLMSLKTNRISDNICTIGLETPTKGIDVTSAGLLISISYEFDEGVSVGMYPVYVDVQDAGTSADGMKIGLYSGIILISKVLGDLNEDGKVSLSDSLLMRQAVLGTAVTDISVSDLNNDGSIDSADSLLLRKYLANWDVSFVQSYGYGTNCAQIFDSAVFGIGYGMFNFHSEQPLFEVIKNGETSDSIQISENTYCVNLKTDDRLKIRDSSGDRTITYVMNGGNITSSMPAKYIPGNIVDLGCPTNDDESLYFIGWFMDPEYTENILYIPSDCDANLTLYALWDDSLVGHGYSDHFEYNLKSGSSVATIEIEFDNTFWIKGQDGTYFARSITKYINHSSPDVQNLRWVNVLPTGARDNGIVTIDIDGWKVSAHEYYMTNIYGTETLRQYYIYDWVLLKEEYRATTSGIQHVSDGVVAEIYNFEVKEECDVYVYSGYGVDAPSHTTVQIGESVTLTAESDEGFKGWYDSEGNRLSESMELTIDYVLEDTILIAANDKDYDTYHTLGDAFESESEDENAEWLLVNLSTMETVYECTGGTFSYTADISGLYGLFITEVDENSNVSREFLVLGLDEVKTITYEWEYDGTPYSIDFDINVLDYCHYAMSDVNRAFGVDNPDVSFVTYDDQTIVRLAEVMEGLTEDMGEYETANLVLRFVQEAIPYAYDNVTHGVNDYWNFPVETLYIGLGDCEDTAILYCSIMKAMGYDTALMTFTGHALSGINIASAGYEGAVVKSDQDGRKYITSTKEESLFVCPEEKASPQNYYFICETTNIGFDVGDYGSIVFGDGTMMECTSRTVIRLVQVG